MTIGARRVWDELGIRGAGALVGILDTGVDGNHPALAARWRGNFAPAEECWLDVARLGDTSFPVDQHCHGTHVMGTITGLAADDTIGVAPGALWIAVQHHRPGRRRGLRQRRPRLPASSWPIPTAIPRTTDDVPDVVQNSWGVNENFPATSTATAAGGTPSTPARPPAWCLTWSAGNEGPGSQTLRSPADRATTPYQLLPRGLHHANRRPTTISDFSSRGPPVPAAVRREPHQARGLRARQRHLQLRARRRLPAT